MATSLKALYPALGRILGDTPAALYAYQTAFVGGGVLDSLAGRGPGSGVRASARSVAQFLIGMLAHASIAENVRAARALAKAMADNQVCPLSGAANFEDALAAILADERMAARVNEVVAGATLAQAFIRYDGSDERISSGAPGFRPWSSSIFVGKQIKSAPLRFSAQIPSDTLRKVASLVASIEMEE